MESENFPLQCNRERLLSDQVFNVILAVQSVTGLAKYFSGARINYRSRYLAEQIKARRKCVLSWRDLDCHMNLRKLDSLIVH